MRFSVHTEYDGRVHRLTPLGELDLATAPVLRAEFDAVFASGDARIVVDLTELAFIDSTGVRLLLEMNEVCEPTDRLRVINGSPAVDRIFDLTGVRQLLPIIASADDPLGPARRG